MNFLLGDIGGTHARFALASGPGRIEHLLVLDVEDYADLEAAIGDYLKRTAATRPAHAAFAVAGPVNDGTAAMTNIPWKISARELANRFGFTDVHLVNDFAAVAMAIPALDAGTRRPIGGGAAVANAPAAVLGPGTGLGVAALIPTPTGPVALATEGGHATLAAATPEEDRILARLREQFGHVSAERVLSGPGLEALYAALASGMRAGLYTSRFLLPVT
ncbi:MAG: glucokinase, partial [Pseudomonadota bacterium]